MEAPRSRLHARGHVTSRGTTRLVVRFDGEGQTVSIRPHLVRVLAHRGQDTAVDKVADCPGGHQHDPDGDHDCGDHDEQLVDHAGRGDRTCSSPAGTTRRPVRPRAHECPRWQSDSPARRLHARGSSCRSSSSEVSSDSSAQRARPTPARAVPMIALRPAHVFTASAEHHYRPAEFRGLSPAPAHDGCWR
jgi:hypothetical protein